jgi:hypothetical protein
MTTKYKMLSEQDKANFRAWLGRCPCPECAEFLSPRRSAGAFDVKDELVFDPRFANPRVGDIIELDDGRSIEVIADDDDEAPKPRIPAARPPRHGNGRAFP